MKHESNARMNHTCDNSLHSFLRIVPCMSLLVASRMLNILVFGSTHMHVVLFAPCCLPQPTILVKNIGSATLCPRSYFRNRDSFQMEFQFKISHATNARVHPRPDMLAFSLRLKKKKEGICAFRSGFLRELKGMPLAFAARPMLTPYSASRQHFHAPSGR